jgi:hypothetical protein
MPNDNLRRIWKKNELQMALLSLQALLTFIVHKRELPEGHRFDDKEGVCFNWASWLNIRHPESRYSVYLTHSLMERFGACWLHSRHPGEERPYFVPRNEGYELWEGPNRQLRIHLMRYAIKRMHNMVRRAPE